MAKQPKLTRQEQAFVTALLEGNSAVDAYFLAEYAPGKHPARTRAKANRILKKAHIVEAIKTEELRRLREQEPTAENVKAQFMKIYQLALSSSDLAAASRALEGLTRLLGMEKPSEVVHQHLHATISPKQLQALDMEIARLQEIIAIEDKTIEAEYAEVADAVS